MLFDPKWEAPVEAEPLEPWRLLLLEAARTMENRGHCIGSFEDYSGRVCIYGAVNVASGLPSHSISNFDAVGSAAFEAIERLREHIGVHAIGRWNDLRSQAEVVATMRACALAGSK